MIVLVYGVWLLSLFGSVWQDFPYVFPHDMHLSTHLLLRPVTSEKYKIWRHGSDNTYLIITSVMVQNLMCFQLS